MTKLSISTTLMMGIGLWLMVICPQAVRADGEDVLRVNYGVNFRYLKRLYPVTGVWQHSYAFEIPSKMFDGKHYHLTHSNQSMNGWLPNCIHYLDTVIHPEIDMGKPVPSPPTDSRSLCLKSMPAIKRQISMIKQNHDDLDALVESIYELLPPAIEDRPSRKRSLIPIIGEVASSLFGFATERQVVTISQHLSAVMAVSKGQSKLFTKLTSDLASFSKVASERIDGLAKELRSEALYNAATMEAMALQDKTLSFEIEIERRGVFMNHAMRRARGHLLAFANAIQQLTIGKLPHFLITRQMLNDTIHEIQQGLKGHQFKLIHRTPFEYFKDARFVYVHSGHHLLITVDFPLTVFETGFQAYTVQKLPMIVNDQDNAKMELKTEIKGIALLDNKEFFYYLDEWDIFEIRGLNLHRTDCRVVQRATADHCLVALLEDDASAIKRNCQYQILLNSLFPSIHWLTNNQYLDHKGCSLYAPMSGRSKLRCSGL